jgi:hypothetical protein
LGVELSVSVSKPLKPASEAVSAALMLALLSSSEGMSVAVRAAAEAR